MALPVDVNTIVVRGFWIDETTGLGVKAPGNQPATITFDPVPLSGSSVVTPNLRDAAYSAFVKTRQRVATVDATTGYFAALLVANNDPDLDAYGGRKVTMAGESSFVIEVPHNAGTTTVDAAMAAQTGLTLGATVRAIWLVDAALVTTPAPQPTNSYLTSTQTLSTIASAIEVHDDDPDAHADIRLATSNLVESILDNEEAYLVGVQSAEQRNLAGGASIGSWSAADAATTISSGVDVDSVFDPFGSPTLNPLFRGLRSTLQVRQPGSYPGQTVTKATGLTSTTSELTSLILFNHEGGNQFEIRLFGRGAQSTLTRIRVDGAWISYTPLTGPANDGAPHRLLVTLPDSSKHEVGIEFSGVQAWFAGLTVKPAATVTRVVRNVGPRLIVIGDSQTEGSNGVPDSFGNPLGFAPELGRLLGLDDTWQSGVGDTGYFGDAGGTRATIGERVADDVIAQDPDWVHLAAGQVDAGLFPLVTYSATKAAVAAVLSDLQDGLPAALITAQAPWRPYEGTGSENALVVRNAIRDACADAGVPFYDVSEWLTGTGHVGATTGSGNADLYVSTDAVHLSPAGHKAAGRVIAAALRRSLSRAGR